MLARWALQHNSRARPFLIAGQVLTVAEAPVNVLVTVRRNIPVMMMRMRAVGNGRRAANLLVCVATTSVRMEAKERMVMHSARKQ